MPEKSIWLLIHFFVMDYFECYRSSFVCRDLWRLCASNCRIKFTGIGHMGMIFHLTSVEVELCSVIDPNMIKHSSIVAVTKILILFLFSSVDSSLSLSSSNRWTMFVGKIISIINQYRVHTRPSIDRADWTFAWPHTSRHRRRKEYEFRVQTKIVARFYWSVIQPKRRTHSELANTMIIFFLFLLL